MSRRKQLRDYPHIAGHEALILAALTAWVVPGMPRPTRHNLGDWEMRQAKVALRCILADRNIPPDTKESARAALQVLKDIFHPNGKVGGRPHAG
jgi:hypothetical protein